MQYVVRALDAGQQIQTLVVEALDEADARGQVMANRCSPLSVMPKTRIITRIETRFPLLLFAEELLALLQAGLSVVQALDALIEKDTQAAHRVVLARLQQLLSEGQRLSSALRQQPQVFPPLFVGIVQAAEGTSDLPRALARYLDYETRLQSVRQKILSAAIYPAILLIVGGAVSLFLVGYVVPRFATIYQGSGRELPWASRLLMTWGEFAGQHSATLVASFIAFLALAVWWIRRTVVSGGWWRLLRVLPMARPRLAILELSRFYLTLGMLLQGGIHLPHALKLCVAVVGPASVEALQRTRLMVESGDPLSNALELQGLSTPIASRLLRVGEQSGQLGEMLTRTANFYDSETARWIDRFSRVFEPILMAAIGLVIGSIVLLLYMPIFDLAGSLQ